MEHKKSGLRAAAAGLILLTAGLQAGAEPGYAGEWNKTRLYGHSYNGGDFTDEEYEWIRDHFEYFTVEKPHMRSVYPDPSHELTSRLTATRLINQNPRCRPLMIYSIGAAYCGWFESEAQALTNHPDYFLYDDETGEPTNLNLPLTEENDWYIDVVNSNCANSDLEGIFVDGWRTAVRKYKSNVEYIASNMTGFRLINGFILNTARDGMYDGIDILDKVDGVFIDSFFRNTCDTTLAGETMLDTCLQVPNDTMMVCFSAYDGWSTNHNFSHAAYLIVANDNTYYRWVDEGDHLWSYESLMTWHEDFGREMGEPLAPASKNGYVYTRVFEHCTVTLDIENVTSSIEWGQTNVWTVPEPLAEWKFDDAAGTVAADAANGYDGTVSNAEWTADGISGHALSFSGAGQVDLPAEALAGVSNAVTLSMWVYGSENQPAKDLCFWAEDAAGGRVMNVHLPWSTGKVYWDAGNDGPDDYDRIDKLASEEEYMGQWNHWVFTKDAVNGTMQIYLNGGLWHSESGMTRTMEGTVAASIGGADGNYYSGMIDEVSLYGEVLSADSISDLYELFGPNRAPTADPQSEVVEINQAASILLTGSDPEGSNLTYTVVEAPAYGGLSGTAPSLTYTPVTNFAGIDRFTFIVSDGETNSEPAAVSLITARMLDWTAAAAPQSDDLLTSNLFSTAGTLVYAENTGGPELVFDGITFQASTNAAATVLGVDSPIYTGYHDGIQISSSGMYPAASEVTPTLSGLETGETYRVQMLFFDERSSQDGQRIYVDDEDLGRFGNGPGGAGLLVTGTFTASDSTHSFKLQRTDNATDVLTDQVQLNALAVFRLEPYDLWAESFSLDGENVEPEADSDTDGLNNLLEYAFGADPGLDDAAEYSPESYVENRGGTNFFYYVYNRRANDPAVTYTPVTSTNLAGTAGWETNRTSVVGESAESGGMKSVTNRLDAAAPAGFIQLEIRLEK